MIGLEVKEGGGHKSRHKASMMSSVSTLFSYFLFSFQASGKERERENSFRLISLSFCFCCRSPIIQDQKLLLRSHNISHYNESSSSSSSSNSSSSSSNSSSSKADGWVMLKWMTPRKRKKERRKGRK